MKDRFFLIQVNFTTGNSLLGLFFFEHGIIDIKEAETSRYYLISKDKSLESVRPLSAKINLLKPNPELEADFILHSADNSTTKLLHKLLSFNEKQILDYLKNEPGVYQILISNFDLSNPDKPFIDLKEYEIENQEPVLYNHGLNQEEIRYRIDNAIFYSILNNFYSRILYNDVVSIINFGTAPFTPRNLIKSELDIEKYREKITIPKGQNSNNYLDQIRQQRTIKSNAELKTDYILAFKDAVKLINRLIELQTAVPGINDQAGESTTAGPLIPAPNIYFNDISKTTNAIFNPKNTIDKDLNLLLTGHPDNLVNTGKRDNPLYTGVKIQFDRETLDQELIKAGRTPLNDLEYKAFNVINSFIFDKYDKELNIPSLDILDLEETAPWRFNENEAVKMLFNTEDPTEKQCQKFRDVFKIFMRSTLDIDTTDLARSYIERQLDEYYSDNQFDRTNFSRELEALINKFEKVNDVKNFIYGSYRRLVNPNGTESVIYTVYCLPTITRNTLLIQHFQGIPPKYYKTPKRIRSNNGSFYALQGELVKRIYKAGQLIEQGKVRNLTKKDNAWLLCLDLEHFIESHAISFKYRRDRTKLLNQVIETLNSNRDNMSYFIGADLYPIKKHVKKTHIVLAYKGKNGKLICDKKYLDNLEYLKETEGIM